MMNQSVFHFQYLPSGYRALYTLTLLVLGLGYIFALIQTYSVHAAKDGRPGLSPTDLELAYAGKVGGTRLEAAIKGPMSGMLHQEDVKEITAWIQDGAKEQAFAERVKPIIQEHCQQCHGEDTPIRMSNPHLPRLYDYADIMEMVQIDTGASTFTLVRVSHIHLFAITFIFFITGSIFLHAHIRPLWLKCTVIVLPFVAILVDILSWYLTKIYRPFSWVVYVGGILMMLSFAFQWISSMYQMWFYKLPAELVDEQGSLPTIE